MAPERAHGTAARYGREYKAARARSIAYGRWQPYMDAKDVRAHVAALVGRGMSCRQVAAAAGVSQSCVQALMVGRRKKGLPPSRRLLTKNGKAILAVRLDPDAVPDRALVDATGTRRRVQALAALGYSVRWQSRQLGRAVNNFHDVLSTERVFAKTAREVRGLYDRWSMTPPQVSPAMKIAKATAMRNGWVPPLAWDDDTIDDPDALPDMGGQTTREQALAEDAEELIGTQGYTVQRAAERLGVSSGYLSDARLRARKRAKAVGA